MAAPAALIELVEQSREHPEMYMSEEFGGMAVRRQFSDPFFELLGWDVCNRQNYAEAYKNVVHEDSLKFGGSTKVPDYSFRAGRQAHEATCHMVVLLVRIMVSEQRAEENVVR